MVWVEDAQEISIVAFQDYCSLPSPGIPTDDSDAVPTCKKFSGLFFLWQSFCCDNAVFILHGDRHSQNSSVSFAS